MNINRWLAPALTDRSADTLREIADRPTVVEQWRDDVLLGTLTVRLVKANRMATLNASQDAETASARYTVIAAAATDLRRSDRLVAAGGVVYVLSHVPPSQLWRTEASADVLQ